MQQKNAHFMDAHNAMCMTGQVHFEIFYSMHLHGCIMHFGTYRYSQYIMHT